MRKNVRSIINFEWTYSKFIRILTQGESQSHRLSIVFAMNLLYLVTMIPGNKNSEGI